MPYALPRAYHVVLTVDSADGLGAIAAGSFEMS